MREYDAHDLFDDMEDHKATADEMKKQYQKALDLAQKAHAGQTRDEGTPYYDHVARVAERVVEIEIRPSHHAIIAVLHDVLEDTDVTAEELRKEFGPRVAAGVQLLTKDKVAPGYSEANYLQAIVQSDNFMMPVIKMLDRIDNLRSLEACPDAEKKVKYVAETREIFIPIFAPHHKKKDTYQKVLQELISVCDSL